MASMLFRMPSGIPGVINRASHCTVEAGYLLASAMPAAFGVALAVDPATGRYRGLTAGDSAASVAGVLVRPYPTSSTGALNDGLGSALPGTAQTANILKRGYMTVYVGGAAAAPKGGTVYVRISAPAAGKPVGGFEAAADGANTVALPASTYWMGPADAAGNGEIAYNI